MVAIKWLPGGRNPCAPRGEGDGKMLDELHDKLEALKRQVNEMRGYL
jgi:hypothetical protein